MTIGSRSCALVVCLSLSALWPIGDVYAQEEDEDVISAEDVQPAEPPRGVRVYQLEELTRLALQNASVIEEHRARLKRAQWQAYRANNAWVPRVDATTLLAPVPANADPSRFDENLDDLLSLNIGPYLRQSVRVVMPIYTFGRIATAQELAEIGVDVAKVQAEQAILEHFFLLKQAYYGLQLSQAFQEILDEGGKLIGDQLEEMEDARDFGDATFDVADLRRLQIFNAEFEGRELDNARLSEIAAEGIRYLAGIEGTVATPALNVRRTPEPLEGLEHYMGIAMETRPEIVQINRAVEARQLQRKLQRRNYYPNIFLAGDFTFGWSTEDPALQPICRRPEPDAACVPVDNLFARPYTNPFSQLSVGIALGMSWQFDYVGQRGQLGEVDAQLDEIVAQRERAIGALRLDILRLYREADHARQKIAIAERRYDAARRWRNQVGLRLEIADGNLKDALDPLRAYYEARIAFLEAHHNYLVARAALARAIGLRDLADAGAQGEGN
jgi:outer membrane protein TolC